MSVQVTAGPEDIRSADSEQLIKELSEELGVLYDSDGTAGFEPSDVEVPRAAFVVARIDGYPVGCGALRPLEDNAVEVKRMYTRSGYRRKGVAQAILAELERLALEFGYSSMKLQTGPKQPEAAALYERVGYYRIPIFSGTWDQVLAYQKDLSFAKPSSELSDREVGITMSEVYRLAAVEDAERLLHVIYEAYETIRELELHWPAANADLALIQDNITKNECYVLELNGEIAATLTLSKEKLHSWETDLPFIKWFAVDPEYQGIGIGTRLLTWVEKTIIRDKLGAPALTLATAEKHPWLLAMYEKKGYERIESIDRGNGDGTMHLLRKVVNPALYDAQLRTKEEQNVYK